MKELLIEGLKIVVCSGVLLGAYRLLLDRRVSFGWCRDYLLLLPLAACVIPRLRIPVLPALPMPAVPATMPVGLAPVEAWVPEPAAAGSFPTLEAAVVLLWLAGTLWLAGIMLRQAAAMRRLRKRAVMISAGRWRVASLPVRVSPFSFGRTIYLWAETPADDRRVIIAHETSHIVHRHSAERIAMECMKALLWWNPFVWLAARRLVEAEEYEADRDVLTGGFDREHYMNALFRQLCGYSPDIASGLRNSLTKKRFQMMTTHFGGRYVLLRLAGTLLAFAGLLCAFSLTARASDVRNLPAAEQQPADRPEPLYIVNGKEVQTLEEAFELGRTLGSAKKGTQVRLRRLLPEEGVEKYGEKGRNGVFEFTVSASGEASATTVPEMVVVGFAAENETRASGTVPPAPGGAADADEPWLVVETMPKFRGGDLQDFRTWVQSRVKYPVEVLECGISGRVVVTFVIERDGSMSSIKVLQTPDRLLTNEVLRVIESVPAGSWAPGMQQGEPVRVKYTLPVEFRSMTGEEASFAKSQTAETAGEDEPCLMAETMPKFRGGDLLNFRAWVQSRVKYPMEALEQGISGRVVVAFVVECDGSVGAVEVLQAPDKSLAAEVVRVIESVPAGSWAPGMQQGEPVRVKYIVPVDFKMPVPETPEPASEK